MSYLPLLLLALWRPPSWAEAINAPSASASTSLSSSLLNLAAAAESTNGGHISPLDQLNSRQECKAKNLKQQQKMFAAKLEAHRCLVRDTVVELPIPDDVIATFVMPSHVVVPRCTGENPLSHGCVRRRHASFGHNALPTHSGVFFVCPHREGSGHRLQTAFTLPSLNTLCTYCFLPLSV